MFEEQDRAWPRFLKNPKPQHELAFFDIINHKNFKLGFYLLESIFLSIQLDKQ